MEQCTGGTLLDLLYKKEKIVEREAGKVALQLLEAVLALHVNGIVHRDIKLENVLLAGNSSDLHVKLVDFGTAVQIEKAGAEVGYLVGTVQYASPEALNTEYSPACDIWAIGVTLFVLLSGTFPFITEVDTCRGSLNLDDANWEDISLGPKDLLRKLLVVDSKKRLSAKEVRVPVR